MSISSKIDALPPLRDVVAAHGLRANKVFGQNYLFDLNLTAKITRYAGDLSGHTVLEIGPGPGGLTRALLTETNANIIAIEKDTRFIEALQPLVDASEGRLRVIEGDALETDLLQLAPAPRSVIANLPYNIGTELLVRWLQNAPQFNQFILMFQKEVVDRLTAKTGSKAYGRLSVLAQSMCHVDRVMIVPASAFTPPPKVTSAVVRLRPKPDAGTVNLAALEKITQAAFGQRRKMLRQSLKAYLPQLEQLGIPSDARAEDVSVENFIKLAELAAS